MEYRVGLDVGSTTAKMALIGGDGRTMWSRYERHNARVNELLADYLRDVQPLLGDSPVSIAVTGSVGMATAELLGAEFVQEVVAASHYAKERHPEVRSLIDIGGEDSKVVLLEGARTVLRMNGNCAGGTGAFIDQMAVLMGITPEEMNRLALQSSHSYTIAARCGVFAKTDVQNLMSRNVAREDIASSIFHSIAVQTITTLAHGCDIQAPILLCGGPLTFLSALRRSFADYMQIDESCLMTDKESNLIPAIGCALSASGKATTIAALLSRVESAKPVKTSSALKPLFRDEWELEQWQQEKQTNSITVATMRRHERVVLGIDSGSTTTKIVAARTDGTILFRHYAQSLGNPIKAVADGLDLLQRKADEKGTKLEIVGSCSTGYGEELIKAAFALDGGIIETIAHYQAAQRLAPDVSFILDIGGQDMKAIFVDKGIVTRMELNEACSSGCGTFLQTFAQSLGHDIGDFARMACTARLPQDLGTRCTVFMNSKVKQVLREGASTADIAAGLAYSVVNNCLYKVLKLKDPSEMGDHIVVQGGTMRNDAVVRALELLTGKNVRRSNMPEMMGAYGCALHAARHPSAARSIDNLLASAHCETVETQCRGCENRCHIVRHKFAANGQNGRTYVSGNKCERIFNNHGENTTPGRNIYAEKKRLLFDRDSKSQCSMTEDQPKRRIGLPRVLNMYENYPFWHRLLTDCGIEVVLSGESSMPQYESALCTVMSDNICFPAKLVHSHIAQLAQGGVERILMPYVVFEQQESKTAINSFNCPIVSGYSDVVRSAMTLQVPLDSPVINFSDRRLLKRQVTEYLQSLGIKKRTADTAFKNAWFAQKEYEHSVRQLAREILYEGRKQGRLTILLAGRPYHTDPLIQHRLSDTIAAMGVNVISEDIVRNLPDVPDGETNTVRQWAYVNRIIKAAQWVGKFASDVQFVELTSFGCGPDAFIQDEVRTLLARHGRMMTLLKVDDVTNVGSLKLRVRSLIESLQAQGQKTCVQGPKPFQTTSKYTAGDKHRKILAPHISEFITPILPSLCSLAGYDVEVLPPSDAESARIGLHYANNEVCYPATLIVGDIIRGLQSGRYDLSRTTIAMSQTGGQCRATSYAGLIKRAMVQAGFADVPLVTLGVSEEAEGCNEQEELDVPWLKIAPLLLNGILYTDAIAKMYYPAVVREKQPGMAAALRDKFLLQGAECIRHRSADDLLWTLGNAASEFNLITRCDVEAKPVGIVGEIFLKFNHFAHLQLTDILISRGYEVVPPEFTPFFMQWFVNAIQNKKLGISKSHVPSVAVKMLYALVSSRIHKINNVAGRYRLFRPFSDIREEAQQAFSIVSPAAQFGEGWILPGEIVGLVDSGVRDVISLQPFGCIANHIVSKGIEKSLMRRYPHLNLLTLDFDSGVSSVNVTNRLLLFLDAGLEESGNRSVSANI